MPGLGEAGRPAGDAVPRAATPCSVWRGVGNGLWAANAPVRAVGFPDRGTVRALTEPHDARARERVRQGRGDAPAAVPVRPPCGAVGAARAGGRVLPRGGA